jgi:hypothetical protein
MPAEAGIQPQSLDSRLRGNDRTAGGGSIATARCALSRPRNLVSLASILDTRQRV